MSREEKLLEDRLAKDTSTTQHELAEAKRQIEAGETEHERLKKETERARQELEAAESELKKAVLEFERVRALESTQYHTVESLKNVALSYSESTSQSIENKKRLKEEISRKEAQLEKKRVELEKAINDTRRKEEENKRKEVEAASKSRVVSSILLTRETDLERTTRDNRALEEKVRELTAKLARPK